MLPVKVRRKRDYLSGPGDLGFWPLQPLRTEPEGRRVVRKTTTRRAILGPPTRADSNEGPGFDTLLQEHLSDKDKGKWNRWWNKAVKTLERATKRQKTEVQQEPTTPSESDEHSEDEEQSIPLTRANLLKLTKEQGMGDPLLPLRGRAHCGPDGLSSERVAVTASHLSRDLGFSGDEEAASRQAIAFYETHEDVP